MRRKRLCLNSSYLPKDRSSKRNSKIINPLLGSFTNQGRLMSRLEVKTIPKLCHKLSYLPPILIRAHSSFLKIIYSRLRNLHSPSLSLLRCYLILSSKDISLSYSSFPGHLSCIHEENMLINFCLFFTC